MKMLLISWPILALLTLWTMKSKLNFLSLKEKEVRWVEIGAYCVLAFIPILNLFVWLWVTTEGLETHYPHAGKSWTGGA